MAVKCKNGHWYDPNVFRSCPHCKKKNETLSLMVDKLRRMIKRYPSWMQIYHLANS